VHNNFADRRLRVSEMKEILRTDTARDDVIPFYERTGDQRAVAVAFSGLSAACAQFMFGKTSLASSFL